MLAHEFYCSRFFPVPFQSSVSSTWQSRSLRAAFASSRQSLCEDITCRSNLSAPSSKKTKLFSGHRETRLRIAMQADFYKTTAKQCHATQNPFQSCGKDTAEFQSQQYSTCNQF